MAVRSQLSSAPSCRLPSGFASPSRSLFSFRFFPKSLDLRPAGGVRACAANPRSDGAPASTSLASIPSSVIDFLTLCHPLKTIKRQGWVKHGIKGPESIADHTCIKIAIVHDIAEAIVGDITSWDGIPKEEKGRREQAALDEMCEVLGGGLRADEIKELWAEYEKNSSIEAKLVKDFDKVEMILQALEYEMAHGKVLDEFFLSAAGKFQTDIGKSWAAEVTQRRNKRLGIQA